MKLHFTKKISEVKTLITSTHTSSNTTGKNRIRQTIVEYTHPLTLNIGHTTSVKPERKKNDWKESLIREEFKGTNTTFSFFSISPLSPICCMQI